MTTTPRCRFAPSPTGYLHVGNARAALFNWLFARRAGGVFLLRVEDTDVERSRPELIEVIYDSLRWLGLDWDGDVVHQSDRLDAYVEAAGRLHAAGLAYACDCTPEQVQARNEERGGPPGYDGFCRDRGLDPGPGRALRFRTPEDGTTSFDDLVRGHVRFDNASIEDFVLLRSNGTPVFLLANLIDDEHMGITHVVRGEEHVNGTPKYLLIGEALGLGYRPLFAHLPLLVNEQRKKLSKRRDDVSIDGYRAAGYLPEAMRNYLALLGWGPDDGVEIRPIGEIVERFRLEDVSQSPAFFDTKKLDHINGEYIRMLDPPAFVEAAAPFLPVDQPAARAALEQLAVEARDRVRTLAEVPSLIEFLWLDEPAIDTAAWEKVMLKGRAVPDMLDAAVTRLAALDISAWKLPAEPGDDSRAPEIRDAVRAAAVDAGLVNAEGGPQLSKAQAPVRVAVTGRSVGPPLWESLAALGRERTLERLTAARGRLG